jgi:hypothetical protein
MRNRIALTLVAISVLAVGLLVAASPASASSQTFHGCPSGAVCLYTNDESGSKYLDNQPNWVFFSYGAHNISNAIGHGEYVDNQYGGTNIGSYLCSGYNGTGTVLWQASGPNQPGRGYVDVYTYVDFTPVNSVKLVTNWQQNKVGSAC